MDEFADAVALGGTNLTPKQKIEFRYDFGDDWRFQVLVEKVDETATMDQPAVIEIHGEAPKQYDWDEDDDGG
jgi:Cft2 family RNA processing exonuclease